MKKTRSLFLVWLFLLMAFSAIAQTPQTLNLSQPVEREIKDKESHLYSVQIPANQTAVFEVDQKGVDIGGSIYKGDAKDIYFEFETPSGNFIKDIHLLTADETATYKLELFINSNDSKSGNYVIKLAEIRPTTAQDLEMTKATAEIRKLFLESKTLRDKGTAEGRKLGIEKLQQIIPLSRIAKDKSWEMQSLELIATTLTRLGESRKALEFFNSALKIAEELNFKKKQAYILTTLGYAHYTLVEGKNAIVNHEKSLLIAREIKDREGEGSALNNLALVYRFSGEYDKALENLEQSLVVYRELKDRVTEAIVLINFGLVYSDQREKTKALAKYEEGIAIFREFDKQEEIAAVNQAIGVLYINFGDARTSVKYYLEALTVAVKSGDRAREATSLYTIATAYDRLGEFEKALESYQKAIKIDRELKNNREDRALNNLAVLMERLGDSEASLNLYTEALNLRRKNGDVGGQITTLSNLGTFYKNRGDFSKAREFYNEALKKAQQIKDRRSEGANISKIGALEISENKLVEAVTLFEQALVINRQVADRREEATTLGSLGTAIYLQGDKNKALDLFVESGKIWNSLEDKHQESSVLYNQAKIQTQLNRLPEARKNIESAINLVENLRTKIPIQRLRTSYFAKVQQYYELYIEIQMLENSPNLNVSAFETSERSRSRSLLELLQEARIDIRQGIDVKLLDGEKKLLEILTEKSRIFTNQLSVNTKPELIEKAKKEIIETENELENLRSQIRKQNPRYASLTQTTPLSAKEIQNLLDNETVLLEFKLGEVRSFLWLVTKTEIKVFYLPKREEIEKIGKEFYETVIAKKETSEISAKLNQMLFSQITSNIKNKRLAIVSDGILQFIPFSAITENEIISLPSASVLAELRQSTVKPTNKTIAIFADPIFDEKDVRLENVAKKSNNPKNSQIGQVLRDFSFGENLPRLLSSRFEANNISDFVPKNSVDVRLDFEANRENVTNESLANYRILHFATHGLLDSNRPEFSGLVFSLFDKEGKTQDGFLRLNQIYNLNLNSDLVVLSACQTALGKDVRGEGLIGLTRGFMYAGAKRIIATLWKVDDAATAEFMKKFYQNLLVKKLKPANALRQTQNEIKQIPRFKSPYYWAGFTIQGDWR
ncbi:MAG: CHAT domain-containing tetratricopeptide repeat protein [Acidobacteriota bacterium]